MFLRVRYETPPKKEGGATGEGITLVRIQSPMAPKGEIELDMGRAESEALYAHYHGLCDLFLQQCTVSRYADLQGGWDREVQGPQLGSLLHSLKTSAAYGRLDPDHVIEHPLVNVDQMRAHTSVLCEIVEALPVVLDDDLFVDYVPGALIDPHAYYISLAASVTTPLPPRCVPTRRSCWWPTITPTSCVVPTRRQKDSHERRLQSSSARLNY